MVYPALLPLVRTPRPPVVDWTDAPADLNGLVRFAERRNLVSARVPSHFKRRDTTVAHPDILQHTTWLPHYSVLSVSTERRACSRVGLQDNSSDSSGTVPPSCPAHFELCRPQNLSHPVGWYALYDVDCINCSVWVTETDCVFFDVRPESLCINWTSLFSKQPNAFTVLDIFYRV